MHRASACVIVAALAFNARPGLSGDTVEVVYSSIEDDATANIPGGGGSTFGSFLELHHSPDGNHWIIKGFAAGAGTIDVMIVGSGTTGSLVAMEGGPSPVAGSVHCFLDSQAGVNDSGQYVFGSRLDGIGTDVDEIVFLHDGVSLGIAVREGDPAPGLVDLGFAGDELFGNSLNSSHILADGTPCFHADLIQNVDSDFRSALYQGGTVLAQEGTAVGGGTYAGFLALGGNSYTSSADGSAWIVESDIDPSPLSSTESVILTGEVVISEGQVLKGMPGLVESIFAVHLTGGGTWFARGSAGGAHWAVRDGALIASAGDPILPGAEEAWVTIGLATGDDDGLVLLAGSTDEPDADFDSALVLMGDRLLVREGDAVDVNGDGLPVEDVFIRTIDANSAFISSGDGHVYFTGSLRNGAGTMVGDAIMRLPLLGTPGDINADGLVDIDDLLLLLGAWGPCLGCPEDVNGDDVVDVNDLLIVLANWT